MTWISLDALRKWREPLDKHPMVMGAIVGAVVMAVIICNVDPDWFSFGYWQEGGKDVSRSEVLRNVGLLAVGIVGLSFGIWRAWTAHLQTQASVQQADVAQQGQFTDRFSTAVEHLGSRELPVRLGGVYALWRLAEDSADRDKKSIWDILCAFIRHPPHEPEESHEAREARDAGNPINPDPVRPDVQAILDLLITKIAAQQRLNAEYTLNLDKSNLSQANLSGAILIDAELFRANLSGANLSGADLLGAFMNGAKLIGATLPGATLSGTYLSSATLTSATLIDAIMIGANLSGSDLTGAFLNDSDLSKMDLSGATLSGANLSRSILHHANLNRAGLHRTNFIGADLTGADLSTAYSLSQEQLDTTCVTEGGTLPNVPDGLTPPTRICQK